MFKLMEKRGNSHNLLTEKSKEEIRLIRMNIQQLSREPVSTIAVTSPEENKRQGLISCSLAASFAEMGKKVLVIDANIRQPSVHNMLLVSPAYGFTEAIKGHTPHLQSTYIPGLDVMTAGALSVKYEEMWTVENIRKLTDELEKTYEIIIFHAPAFLKTADAHILSLVCKDTILVIKENKTKLADLAKVKTMLERSGKKLTGSIYQMR